MNGDRPPEVHAGDAPSTPSPSQHLGARLQNRMKSTPDYEPIDDGETDALPDGITPEVGAPAFMTEDGVIVPEDGSWKLKWDIFVLVLIIYSSVIIPFRISFEADAEGGMWWFELIMSFCFLADLAFSFRTAYWHEGAWITDRKKIKDSYLGGWFWIDAPSSLPLELLDLIPGDTSELGFLRFLRMFRLLRLLKLLKLDQLIEQIEEQLEMSLRFLRLVIMLVKVCFVGHFLGCFWYMTALNAERNGEVTWVEQYAARYDYDLQDYTNGQYYLWSLYWALTTLTTVGYGDITPANDAERLYASFSVLVGGMIFGFMISQVGTLIASLDRQAALIEEKLDSVKEYASSRKLPKSLHVKLTKHFKYFYSRQSVFDENELLGQCPPALRGEVTQFILNSTLGKLPIAKRLDPTFQTELFPHIKPISFAPGDVIFAKGEVSGDILFLLQGEVNVMYRNNPARVETVLTPTEEIFVAANKSCTAGEPHLRIPHAGSFGETMLTGLRRAKTHIAKSYCEALQLTKDGIESVKATNPRATTRFLKLILVELKRKDRLESLQRKLCLFVAVKGSREWAARYIQAYWEQYTKTYLSDKLEFPKDGLTPFDKHAEQREREAVQQVQCLSPKSSPRGQRPSTVPERSDSLKEGVNQASPALDAMLYDAEEHVMGLVRAEFAKMRRMCASSAPPEASPRFEPTNE